MYASHRGSPFYAGIKIEDSGKKIDTMANVSNLAGNPISVVIAITTQN